MQFKEGQFDSSVTRP
nr:unnamed protein product [Callosobruchus chinensis]